LSVQFIPADLGTYEIPEVKQVTIDVTIVINFTQTALNTSPPRRLR
jgi:hypothetical protein